MNQYTKSVSDSEDLSLITRSDWSVGPRTAAWDRLWRLILDGLDAQPSDDGEKRVGREGGDA